jgi:protein SCO1/2
MTQQTSRLLLLLAAFAVGLVLCVSLVLVVAQRGSIPIPQAAAIGGPFHLVDQQGRTVTDQDMKGRPFLVFFGFTNCPEICPTTLFEMSEVFRSLGTDADRAGGLFITVDPERDTPQMLKEYLSNFDPHLRGLTGDAQSLASAIKGYRIYARKVPTADGSYTMDHTALVYLMDKDGRFVAPFNLKRRPEEAAADLRRNF